MSVGMTEKEAWDSAAEAIRATGARNTSARTRVLAVLLASHEALTEPQIEAAMSGPPLDCVTVYRVLEWLLQLHLIHRLPGRDGVWRFATLRHGRPPNAVFECVTCARLLPLVNAPAVDPVIPPGYEAEGALLHVTGTCPTCAEARRELEEHKREGDTVLAWRQNARAA